MKHITLAVLAVGLLGAAVAAFAAEPIVGTGIDANTFIVGHPASPRWITAHANHEHPAVLQARLAHQASIDANRFLVQPPASVTWVSAPAAPAAPAVVAQAR